MTTRESAIKARRVLKAMLPDDRHKIVTRKSVYHEDKTILYTTALKGDWNGRQREDMKAAFAMYGIDDVHLLQ